MDILIQHSKEKILQLARHGVSVMSVYLAQWLVMKRGKTVMWISWLNWNRGFGFGVGRVLDGCKRIAGA